MYRLFNDKIFSEDGILVEEDGMIHVDDWEMREDVQEEIMTVWEKINSDNFLSLADAEGYWTDFYQMFGFKMDGVDYSADVEV